MSGVYGLIQHQRQNSDLLGMLAASFSGGDGFVHFVAEPALLGVQKQALPKGDKHEHGSSPDGKVQVVFSGEIINRHEIISAEGEWCATGCGDAELFAGLFSRYGSDCIKKISGQFCAALWQCDEQSLHLFLDRVGGIKSIYYAQTDAGFAFSSRLPSLLGLPGCNWDVDGQSVYDFFSTGYILPPATIASGIRKMRPGEEIVYRNGKVRSHVIDRIDFVPSAMQNTSVSALADALDAALHHLTREPETGFLLSGGVDSSSLVALAARKAGRQLTTFTASFPGSPLDESDYARIVARAHNCDCRFINMGGRQFLDDLPTIVYRLDEPFIDFSAIPTYHLFEAIRKETSLVISGDGPDHLFGRYYPLAAKRHVAANIGMLAPLLGNLPVSFLKKMARVARCPLDQAYREIYLMPSWGLENVGMMRELVSAPIGAGETRECYLDGFPLERESSHEAIFNALSLLDFYVDGSFGVFAKVGKMAAAHGLVIREPFLERGVSDLIAGIPMASKVAGSWLDHLRSRGKGKYLLRHELGRQVLPPEIVEKTKGGFTPPLSAWLREGICRIPAGDLLCRTILERKYLNELSVDKLLAEHRQGTRDWSTVLFMILTFDLWVRMFMEASDRSLHRLKLSDIYPGIETA